MKRIKVLFGQRRLQVLVAMAALLLAVSVVIGSGANFTSTSANPSNVFTAGSLTHTNSKQGAAILTATLMKPGDMRSGTVVITNTGDLPGAFTLTNSNVLNPVLPAVTVPVSTPFSNLLTVKIFETGLLPLPVGTRTQIYGGTSGAVLGVNPAVSLGTFAPGESHQYDFEVTFPAGTPAHDNPYQKASASLQYDWTASAGL
jgi:hypothetical protein